VYLLHICRQLGSKRRNFGALDETRGNHHILCLDGSILCADKIARASSQRLDRCYIHTKRHRQGIVGHIALEGGYYL
jgi:hypothetical protein